MTLVVTTAARRIVRAVNAEKLGFRLWFDRDGRVVERIYDPERRCFGPLPDDAWIEWSPSRRRRATEQAVQNYLTALIDALTVTNNRVSAQQLAEELVDLRFYDRGLKTLTLAEELDIIEKTPASLLADSEDGI